MGLWLLCLVAESRHASDRRFIARDIGYSRVGNVETSSATARQQPLQSHYKDWQILYFVKWASEAGIGEGSGSRRVGQADRWG